MEHPRPSLVRQEPVKEMEKSRPEMAPPRGQLLNTLCFAFCPFRKFQIEIVHAVNTYMN